MQPTLVLAATLVLHHPVQKPSEATIDMEQVRKATQLPLRFLAFG